MTPLEVLRREVAKGDPIPALEPVAIRYYSDGFGWLYIDSGSGSDWVARGMEKPDAEMLFTK